MSGRPEHAVVIGAGMGGLATAQALSRHVARVTVVERDQLPDEPGPRSGIPQGRHAHVLQPGGLAALERLLPGFSSELVAGGAVPLAAPRDVLWLSAAGWMRPFRDHQRTLLSATRDLIEWVARRMVLATPGIEVRTGVDVVGLAVRDGRAAGLDVRPRGAAASGAGRPHALATETILADLVVDSSGRRSHAPDWLEAAGYERPPESTVDADLAYASRIYRRSDGDLPGWRAVFLQARPPHTRRMGVLFPIEGDRWLLTLAGTNGDVPPTDEAGFLEFAAGMRAPTIAETIARLEPLSSIVGYRRTENRRRHYEKLRRVPERFVVVGDAACAFNPVYGQGMSAGALTAEALGRCLDAHLARHTSLDGLAATAQRAVAKANAGAWMVATSEDLRYPETTGGKVGFADRLLRRYLDRVVATAAVDSVVNEAFFDVVALLAEPTSLLRPALAARVLGRRHPTPADARAPHPVAVEPRSVAA
jgi:2-polyprenyl-6-methoxyphenol hydroxylase-like FAD-dependent oxidoreductase